MRHIARILQQMFLATRGGARGGRGRGGRGRGRDLLVGQGGRWRLHRRRRRLVSAWHDCPLSKNTPNKLETLLGGLTE